MSSRISRRLRWFPRSVARLVAPALDDDKKIRRDSLSSDDEDAQPDNPLLGDVAGDSNEETPSRHDGQPAKRRGQGRTRRQWYILFLAIVLVILAEFAEFLSGPAQQQVFLEIACRNHYASTGDGGWQDTSGEKCRIEPVQSELALVDGWLETFQQIPGIFLAIPYGVLADRIGRKPVLLLGQFGIFMSEIFIRLICWWSDVFPLRLVWAASFWRIVGGGNQVQNAMMFVTLADVHDEEHRADSFFKLLAAIFTTEMIVTPLSAKLMTKNPWIPLLISPFLNIAAMLVCLVFLPDTLKDSIRKMAEVNANKDPPIEMSSPQTTQPSHRSGMLTKAREGIAFIIARRNVLYLLFCFFAATVGRKGMFLLLQFIYKKFDWTIAQVSDCHLLGCSQEWNADCSGDAQASYIISLRGFTNLINDLLILPALSYLLTSRRFPFRLSTPSKDLTLSKLSAAYLILSNLLLAMSSSMTWVVVGVVIFAMGNSFFLTARSLVTSMVPPDRVGVLYTAIGMVSGVGVLIAGPLLALSFSIGLKLGEAWLGLPYAVAAGLFSLVGLAVWKIRLPRDGLDIGMA